MKTTTKQKKHYLRIIKYLTILLCVLTFIIIIAPSIILAIIINKPVKYAGNTEKSPLQDIYSPDDFNLASTEMYLVTEDNYNIWVSEVYVEEPKAVIIYLSGIQQPSVTYFYGHSKWMQNHGYASILLEVRGHGNSDGKRICLGYEEIEDVRAVVNYIKSQDKYNAVPIVLHGVSMGGAIAVNSFGIIQDIDGLIAMTAYSSIEDVVNDMMKSVHIPRFIRTIQTYILRQTLRFKFGDVVDTIKPINQIMNTNERPVLLVASAGDIEVRPENLRRLVETGPESIEYWIRDTWEHFILKNNDFIQVEQDDEYCTRILNFLETKIIKD